MVETKTAPATIIRTERGLTIAGTRLTLYEVMDYLRAEWPPHLLRYWLRLTEEQMCATLNYIETHREEVEAEYQAVVKEAEESRAYWEERNRERFAEIATLPPPPGREALYEKVRQRKAELGMS